MARDFQRSKVYEWEQNYLTPLSKRLDREECIRLIKRTHRGKLRTPQFKDGRGTWIARGGPSIINLPRWARHEVVVLHECAHSITIQKYCPNETAGEYQSLAAHGPEFVGIFLELLVKHTSLDRNSLKQSLDERGILYYE